MLSVLMSDVCQSLRMISLVQTLLALDIARNYSFLMFFPLHTRDNYYNYCLFQPQRVHPVRVASVEKDMSQKFMSPYERYSAYIDMKPFLEGGKRRKEAEADDLERVSRVSHEPGLVWLFGEYPSVLP